MTRVSKELLGIVSLAVAGGMVVVSAAIAPSAVAQSVDDFGSDELSGDSGNGIFSNEGLNPFDMIHQSNFGEIPSMSDFTRMQRENLANEAADFRSRQAEMFQQQQNPPVAVPSAQSDEDVTN